MLDITPAQEANTLRVKTLEKALNEAIADLASGVRQEIFVRQAEVSQKIGFNKQNGVFYVFRHELGFIKDSLEQNGFDIRQSGYDRRDGIFSFRLNFNDMQPLNFMS